MNFDIECAPLSSTFVNICARLIACSTTLLLPVSSPTTRACCTPLTRETIDAERAEDLARKLKALADPTRLRLVSIVAASDGEEACVCDLIEPVGLSQPTVSHHLKILMRAPGSSPAASAARGRTTSWCPGALGQLSQLLDVTASR